MSNRAKLVLFFAAVIIMLVITVPQMSSFLVLDHELEEADAIIVLMGEVAFRTIEAAGLYHEGYSEEILMVQSHLAGRELLADEGIILPGQAEQSRTVALHLEVPKENLKIIEGEARSTFDEAQILAEYLVERTELESLILVTSSFHTRRTYIIFNRVLSDLDRDVTLYSRASRYDDFQPEQWWQCRESAKMVVLEYLKLAYFMAWERWQ